MRTVHTVVWVLHTGCFSVHVALVRSACPSKLPKAVLEREVCDLSSLIRIKSLTWSVRVQGGGCNLCGFTRRVISRNRNAGCGSISGAVNWGLGCRKKHVVHTSVWLRGRTVKQLLQLLGVSRRCGRSALTAAAIPQPLPWHVRSVSPLRVPGSLPLVRAPRGTRRGRRCPGCWWVGFLRSGSRPAHQTPTCVQLRL